MNTATLEPSTQEVKAETPQGTKVPTQQMMKQATAETLAKQEQEIASLQAKVIQLEANQKPAVVKKAATNEELEKAIGILEAKNKASLSTASPRLDLSLRGQLGFVPKFSAEQKKDWEKRRDAMRSAHTSAWKAQSAVVIGHLKRAVRNPLAVMAGGIVTRKSDGAVNAVSLKAKNLAKSLKAKGKGKTAAKPGQIAAKMPTAGNAANPAKL